MMLKLPELQQQAAQLERRLAALLRQRMRMKKTLHLSHLMRMQQKQKKSQQQVPAELFEKDRSPSL